MRVHTRDGVIYVNGQKKGRVTPRDDGDFNVVLDGICIAVVTTTGAPRRHYGFVEPKDNKRRSFNSLDNAATAAVHDAFEIRQEHVDAEVAKKAKLAGEYLTVQRTVRRIEREKARLDRRMAHVSASARTLLALTNTGRRAVRLS